MKKFDIESSAFVNNILVAVSGVTYMLYIAYTSIAGMFIYVTDSSVKAESAYKTIDELLVGLNKGLLMSFAITVLLMVSFLIANQVLKNKKSKIVYVLSAILAVIFVWFAYSTIRLFV